MPLTKETTVTWASRPTDPAVMQAVNQKSSEMTAEGKTDGTQATTFLDPEYVVKRPWTDQAAAQEWIAFCEQISTTYQLPIVSSTITDI